MQTSHSLLVYGIVLLGIGISWSQFTSYEYIHPQEDTLEVSQHIHNKLQTMSTIEQPLRIASVFASTMPEDIASTTYHDYHKDTSNTKFVSALHPLSDKTYTPKDLVPITSPYIITSQNSMKLREEAFQQLEKLSKEFYTVFGKKIVIVSAYRSYSYQKNLAQWCAATLCARAWHSEHQLWLTIDIFAATTSGEFLSRSDFNKYYQRLMKNAHRFGRHNTYQKWVAIDTYQVEPRHRRYLGRELATTLHNEWLTFAEWYNQLEE